VGDGSGVVTRMRVGWKASTGAHALSGVRVKEAATLEPTVWRTTVGPWALPMPGCSTALFSSVNFSVFRTVPLSFLFDKHYSIIE